MSAYKVANRNYYNAVDAELAAVNARQDAEAAGVKGSRLDPYHAAVEAARLKVAEATQALIVSLSASANSD